MEDGFLGGGGRVFLREVRCEKLRKSRDTSRFARSARKEHVGADEA
jgi:hypothetical protein